MIYFRVDSNNIISAGHVMRCIAIAQALRSRGKTCVFFTSDRNPVELIEKMGFRCIVLNCDWQNLSTETQRLKQLLNSEKPPILFIDTYSVTPEYVAVASKAAKVCYLGNKRIIAPELSLLINYSTAIDYSFYSEGYDSLLTKLLLGPSYTPLRQEFQNININTAVKVNSVLVTTGNTDNIGMMNAILDKLSLSNYLKVIKIKVIVGSLYKNKDYSLKLYSDRDNIEFLCGVTEIAKIMASCDIAISACGTTLYELAACAVPTVGFSLVPEQVESGEQLEKLGAIEYAGQAYDNVDQCATRILGFAERLFENAKRRSELAMRFHQISDGNGCNRICDAIDALEMERVCT